VHAVAYGRIGKRRVLSVKGRCKLQQKEDALGVEKDLGKTTPEHLRKRRKGVFLFSQRSSEKSTVSLAENREKKEGQEASRIRKEGHRGFDLVLR